MSPSEIAFLALGLVLGIATGAAMVVVLGSRPPTHEIRLTVARDAIPRRASTLNADWAGGALEGPAPGGPGDRRAIDRDGSGIRTIVQPIVAMPLPFAAHASTATAVLPAAADRSTVGGLVAIPIDSEPDPRLAELTMPARPPSLHLVLGGDHRAMLELVDLVSGTDAEQRRAWEELLTAFVEAARARATDLGLLDLPMGNAFWDTFTIEECRRIVMALASTGRRFDGHDSWADGLTPTYRDLSRALADVGIDPRRIRAWPNSAEIVDLFRGARVAADEAVATWAPTLEASDLRALLAERGRGLDPLWAVWDAVRVAIGADAAVSAAPAQA